jgi:hypothetical protein
MMIVISKSPRGGQFTARFYQWHIMTQITHPLVMIAAFLLGTKVETSTALGLGPAISR